MPSPTTNPETKSAAPPVLARALAILSILVGGLCGGLIGYSVTDLQCDDGCTTTAGLIGIGSAVGAALGVAIVAVLTLRAITEWEAKQTRDAAHNEL